MLSLTSSGIALSEYVLTDVRIFIISSIWVSNIRLIYYVPPFIYTCCQCQYFDLIKNLIFTFISFYILKTLYAIKCNIAKYLYTILFSISQYLLSKQKGTFKSIKHLLINNLIC